MIHLRPHHGVCLLNFRGRGYSDEFSQNMATMQARLMAAPESEICITRGADDLCAKCPNLRDSMSTDDSGETDDSCAECPNRRGADCTSTHPPLFDENVLRLTGFQYGQRLTWRTFTDATGPISLHRLDEACPGCEWLALCKEIAAARMKKEPALPYS